MGSMDEEHLPQFNSRGSELWTDGLICAFEFVRGQQKIGREKSHLNVSSHAESDNGNSKMGVCSYEIQEVTVCKANSDSLLDSTPLIQLENQKIAPYDKEDRQCSQLDHIHGVERVVGCQWVPIGWTRISELVQKFQVDSAWSEHQFDLMDDEDDLTVADLATPYWERPAGPIWWCHVAAGHPFVNLWLNSAQWLHPAISIALRDESRLISEKMKHLLYEVDCLLCVLFLCIGIIMLIYLFFFQAKYTACPSNHIYL